MAALTEGALANTTFVGCMPACMSDAVFRPPRGRSALDKTRPCNPITACVPVAAPSPAAAASRPRRSRKKRGGSRSRGSSVSGRSCDNPSPGCTADTPECVQAAALGRQFPMPSYPVAPPPGPAGAQPSTDVCANCPGQLPPERRSRSRSRKRGR